MLNIIFFQKNPSRDCQKIDHDPRNHGKGAGWDFQAAR